MVVRVDASPSASSVLSLRPTTSMPVKGVIVTCIGAGE